MKCFKCKIKLQKEKTNIILITKSIKTKIGMFITERKRNICEDCLKKINL